MGYVAQTAMICGMMACMAGCGGGGGSGGSSSASATGSSPTSSQTITAFVDGVQQSLTTQSNGSGAVSAGDTSDWLIGANQNGTTNWFQGQIAEVIVYNVALTDAQRTDVECYLSTKYGLALPECTSNTGVEPVANTGGIQFWLNAGNLTGSNNSAVTDWFDSSGLVWDCGQYTSQYKPSLLTSYLNGQNVVDFSGSEQYLDCGNMNVNSTFSGTSYTVISVALSTSYLYTEADILDKGNVRFGVDSTGGSSNNQILFGSANSTDSDDHTVNGNSQVAGSFNVMTAIVSQ